MSDTEKSRLAEAILAYLSERPEARDTLEGIAGWWLMAQAIEDRTSAVKAALHELTSRRLLLEQKSTDGHIYYRVNRRKLAEIKRLLEPQRPR